MGNKVLILSSFKKQKKVLVLDLCCWLIFWLIESWVFRRKEDWELRDGDLRTTTVTNCTFLQKVKDFIGLFATTPVEGAGTGAAARHGHQVNRADNTQAHSAGCYRKRKIIVRRACIMICINWILRSFCQIPRFKWDINKEQFVNYSWIFAVGI